MVLNDVQGVGDGKVVPDMLISNMVLFDMVHVNAKDPMDSFVVKGCNITAEGSCEHP